MRSRLIAWLRVILPLAALAILSTLFLLGRKPDPDAAIPYAEVDAEDLARDPRMTRPEFAAVTDGGAAVTLTAGQLRPGADDSGAAQGLRLTWRAAEGLAADLTAPTARVEDQVVHLSGGVRMTTSDGWAMTIPQIEGDLAGDSISGSGGLQGFAPLGRVRADSLRWTRGDDGQQHLRLNGDVRLLYQP